MTTPIKISCPNCQHPFHVEDVLASRISKELQAQAIREKALQQKAYDEKLRLLEQEKEAIQAMRMQQQQLIEQQLEADRQKMREELKKEMRGSFDGYIQQLKEENREKDAKLQQQQQRELTLLKTQRRLEEQGKELELEAERRMAEMRSEMEHKIRNIEQERVEMKLREKDKQLEDLKRMLEEAKRKSEQGSVQLQGEVQELALEELLRHTFRFDLIETIGKGVKGADILQAVKNPFGKDCGRICIESKRTKVFSKEWVEKLKADTRAHKASFGVLVTEAMPKDMKQFGIYEGIWVCTFQEIQGLLFALRDCLIRVDTAVSSQENKGAKMYLLYDYLTGNEFCQQIEAIVESFISSKNSIIRERAQMEKLWKEREKQYEKALTNLLCFYGSVKGIAGNAVPDIDLLEPEEKILTSPLVIIE